MRRYVEDGGSSELEELLQLESQIDDEICQRKRSLCDNEATRLMLSSTTTTEPSTNVVVERQKRWDESAKENHEKLVIAAQAPYITGAQTAHIIPLTQSTLDVPATRSTQATTRL